MSSMRNVNKGKTTGNSGSVIPVPCREWAEKLAAVHSADLSSSERMALEQHLATCANCAAVMQEYRSMDALILELPVVAPLPVSRIASEQLEEASKERYESFPVTVKSGTSRPRKRLTRAGKMLSSVAAVLVVGIIVGSFILLFSLSRNDTNIISSPGFSNSGTIYVATDTMKSEAYAINPANGAILWKHQLGYKLTGPGIVVHGLLVFASYNGSIYAYHTSNGTFAWQTHVDSSGNAAPSLTPVSSASAVVYFSTMGGNFGALRTSNGSLLWKKPLSTCTQICDDYGAEVDNGVYYAFANGLYALNASNGNVIWQNLELKTPLSLTVGNGKIFALPLVGIRARPGKNPSNILELDASNGHPIKSLQGVVFTAGNGVLYIQNLDSTWYAMRISDDTILWRSKTMGCLKGSVLGGSVSGDTIYSAINVTEAGKNGQTGYSEICAMSADGGSIRWDKRWNWHGADAVLVNPATELNGVAYGVAYFGYTTYLEARRLSDGKVLWQTAFPATLQGPTIG